ncbi:MAG: double-CXXCG motif protein [Verrucomicrobiota bacterium]|jgi:uncharacterized double-CXXCG motif protein
MKWFTMMQDEEYAQRYTFNVMHEWSMPGVKCDACGETGVLFDAVYPRILLPPGIDPKPYKTLWPVSPERIAELAAPILPLIPAGLPFGAGSEFGALTGQCGPRKGDFTWTNYNVPLVSKGALERLKGLGITATPTVDTEVVIKSKRPRSFDYLELDIEPRARIAPEFLQPQCPKCGRLELVEIPWDAEPAPVLRTSIPEGLDLIRVWEDPGWNLASERFVDAVKTLGLTGNTFEEVRLS